MFTLKRNQVIITALVVMIAVAGYLNHTDNRQGKQAVKTSIALDDNGEVAALIPYNADGKIATENSTKEGEIGEALTMDENPEILAEKKVETITIKTEKNKDLSSSNEKISKSQEADGQSEVGEAVFVNTSNDSSYFVQAKLEREQARSRQKDILMGMINDVKLDQAQKAVCADAMLEIQKRIEKETAAEAMIESKGFKEVYVRIDDNTVDVVVNKDYLSDAEIAQIEDIVKRKTGMEATQIRISPMKPQ